MAKTSLKVKQSRKPKYSTRAYTRCKVCGRPQKRRICCLAGKAKINTTNYFERAEGGVLWLLSAAAGGK